MTLQKSNRYKGQNPIDYIVYHNPKGVSKVLHDYGYTPPKSTKDLAEATRELIRHRGEKVINTLLEVHPDKKSILQLKALNTSSYCSKCHGLIHSNANPSCSSCGARTDRGNEEDAFTNQFNTPDLEQHYKSLVKRSNQNPENSHLAKEVQSTWNTLRKRKTSDRMIALSPKPLVITTHELLVMGIVFLAGALVGHGIKLNRNHVK